MYLFQSYFIILIIINGVREKTKSIISKYLQYWILFIVAVEQSRTYTIWYIIKKINRTVNNWEIAIATNKRTREWINWGMLFVIIKINVLSND